MFENIKALLGLAPAADFKSLLNEGAVILDVRTTNEYAGGHINGSINIPLSELNKKVSRLGDKKKPVIICCASGMRSSSAVDILKSQGYTQVYNGGGWASLSAKVK